VGLKEYFDPKSGRLAERLGRLVKRDGELEQVLRRHVGGDSSELAQTLAGAPWQGQRLWEASK